jgi:hypothetical protein
MMRFIAHRPRLPSAWAITRDCPYAIRMPCSSGIFVPIYGTTACKAFLIEAKSIPC